MTGPLITLGEPDRVKTAYRGERRVAMRRMTAGQKRAGGRGVRASDGGECLGVEAADDAPLLEALRAWRRERAMTPPSPASGLLAR